MTTSAAIVAALSVAILLFTWLGYPLLVWLRTLWRPVRSESPRHADRPLVSVILATREPAEAIARRVANLAASSWRPLEVVVGLDVRRGVIDLPPIPGIEVRVVPGDAPPGKPGGLNAGVREAKGEILVFADTAQDFTADTVTALVHALLADQRLAGVSGALELEDGAARGAVARYWSFERWLRAREARWHSPVGVTGAVYALWRARWVPLPDGTILDDLHVPMVQVLAGHHIGFCRTAVAIDRRAFAAAAESGRKTRTLTGVYQLCHALPEVLSPRRNPIWFQFVCHKLLRLATPHLILLAGVASLAWLLGALPLQAALALLGGGTLGIATILLLSPRVRRVGLDVTHMLFATFNASRNAARRQWDVW